MTTLESATDAPSSDKTYIIVIATVVPLIAIAVGAGIWYKRWRLKKVPAEPAETFTDIRDRKGTVLELRRMSESSF
jgi:hypothetical protein